MGQDQQRVGNTSGNNQGSGREGTHILWCRGVVVGRVVPVRFVLREGSPRVTDLAQISEHVPLGQHSVVTVPLMTFASSMLFRTKRRRTEGRSGLSW